PSEPDSAALLSPVASGVVPVSMVVPSPPASEDEGPPSSPGPWAKSPRRLEQPPSIPIRKRHQTTQIVAVRRRRLMLASLPRRYPRARRVDRGKASAQGRVYA